MRLCRLRRPHRPGRGIRRAALPGAALAAAWVPAGLAAQATGAPPDVHESARHDFRVVTVAADLDRPWSMAWLPGGEIPAARCSSPSGPAG